MSNVSVYKAFDFHCKPCDHSFRAHMWIEKGEPKGKECPNCDTLLMPLEISSVETGPAYVQADWTRQIPAGWSNFMGEFKKRHGRANTIETHSKGLSEF